MYPVEIGKLKLRNFIYNAAGVWDTTTSQLGDLTSSPYCGAITTKSCTIVPRKGNNYPKYHFTSTFSINSNGLENMGLDYYLNYKSHKPIFYSIGGLSDTERIQMLETTFDLERDNIGVELNLSCPNLGTCGPAYKSHTLIESLRKIFEAVGRPTHTFGLKLPPYFIPEDFRSIADVLDAYKNTIDFITCINSVPNAVDFDINNDMPTIVPNGGYGGLGGATILPIALSNVKHFADIFKEDKIDIAVIGCGGVTTGADVYKHRLAGATAVQVGTHLWQNGPDIFRQLHDEYYLIMQRKGF